MNTINPLNPVRRARYYVPKNKSIRSFIREHRAALDGHIQGRCPNVGLLNDEDRRQWILNDEGLYQWALAEGVNV